MPKHKVVCSNHIRTVPIGCIDVWQVTNFCFNVAKYHGIFKSKELALARAEEVAQSLPLQAGSVHVKHRAALLMADGGYRFVDFNKIKFYDSTSKEVPSI